MQGSQQISLIVTVEDFKHFFKKKQECTSSSPSGRHMGHYKVMLDEIRLGRRKRERMLHRELTYHPIGGGGFELYITCILGKAINTTCSKQQCLTPVPVCTTRPNMPNTSWNKLLFLDLTRQTLIPGTMTDYDATAAFDRVLSSISILTCERVGLGEFMYHLLKNMEL